MKKLIRNLIHYPKNALVGLIAVNLVAFVFGLAVASATSFKEGFTVRPGAIIVTLLWFAFLFLLGYAYQDGWYKFKK
jgi:cation transporter-like permease